MKLIAILETDRNITLIFMYGGTCYITATLTKIIIENQKLFILRYQVQIPFRLQNITTEHVSLFKLYQNLFYCRQKHEYIHKSLRRKKNLLHFQAISISQPVNLQLRGRADIGRCASTKGQYQKSPEYYPCIIFFNNKYSFQEIRWLNEHTGSRRNVT